MTVCSSLIVQLAVLKSLLVEHCWLCLESVHCGQHMNHAAECPFMVQVDGDWRYDARKSIMLWSIDIIDDSNRTGSLEFVVPNTRPESFFPVTVNFNATRTLCQVRCPG